MPEFNFAKTLKLPQEAITETIAFLAAKGFGKTYGAHLLAEQISEAGGRFVAIDPTGKWWCLRLAADGKEKLLDVPIFGGNFGDLPLNPEHGVLIAELIVNHDLSAVLDVSIMEDEDRAKFVGDFISHLTVLKARDVEPKVLHIFLDEAQDFIPQVVEKHQKRMRSAVVRLVRQGRNWGVGVTVISQRPQSLSKEALNMTSTLIIGNMKGPHERLAIQNWVQMHGREKELAEQMKRLPELKKGEMIVWSPEFLNFFGVVHVNKKKSFDASATPKLGDRRTGAEAPKPINLTALRTALEDALETAPESGDVKELQRIVKKMKVELAKAKAEKAPAVDPLRPYFVNLAMTGVSRLRSFADQLRKQAESMEGEADSLDESVKKSTNHAGGPPRKAGVAYRKKSSQEAPTEPSSPAKVIHIRQVKKKDYSPGAKQASLSNLIGKSRRMVECLLIRPDEGISLDTLAVWTGMKRGGGFNNYVRDIKAAGYAEMRDGLLFPTEKLRAAYNGKEWSIDAPETERLVKTWKEKMTGRARDILQLLVDNRPRRKTKEEIASEVGMAIGGGFNNYIRDLKSANLIEPDDRGYWGATKHLFP